MAGLALLVLGVASTEHTLVALLGPRRPDRLGYVWFVQGLVTSELAWLHVVWLTLVTGGLLALGALDDTVGRVGLVLTAGSLLGLVVVQWVQQRAAQVLAGSLRVAADATGAPVPAPRGRVHLLALLRPLSAPDAGLVVDLDVAYGDDPRQQLDVLRSAAQHAPAPVLVHIHGGSWVGGRRGRQSRTLRHEFARRGWVCVTAGYRVSPQATFPDHLIDVKRVIGWVREHATELGADPGRVVVSGVSSGGHLAALAALTANDPALQPGFERRDTSVLGCLATSGIYDLLDRAGDHPGSKLVPFLTSVVMKSDPGAERAAWDAASPITRVHRDAPPFFVVHGHHDALAWRESARRFVSALRAASASPVAYAELPGTQHGFETFYSVRSAHAAMAAVRWGEWLCARADSDGQRVATGRARG